MDEIHTSYLDFELEIGSGQGRDYPVAVVRSPAGEAHETMRFPYDELVLENRLKDLQIALLRSGRGRRQLRSPEEQAVQDFGRSLFDALMVGEIRSRYDVSQREAIRQGKGLRLKLRIQPPDLDVLPWEFLYDPRQNEYVCMSRNTPVVRYLELPQPPSPLSVTPPLRILGMIASPSDLPRLNVEREKQRIERAIQSLQANGLVDLTWLPGQTWRDLQRAMRGGPWHIFHFIGHGGFDRNRDEGFLALADEVGETYRLSATQLGRLLADHSPLRLALLNACEGARGGGRDVFSSTASILVRRCIPAVVAMQYEISDRAAIELAQAFYEALADGMPVDAAVAEARKAISFAVADTVEWGTPVLYMRAPDGLLFNVQKRAARGKRRPRPGAQVKQPTTQGPSQIVEQGPQVTSAELEGEETTLEPQAEAQVAEPTAPERPQLIEPEIVPSSVETPPATHPDPEVSEKPAEQAWNWRRFWLPFAVVVLLGLVIGGVAIGLFGGGGKFIPTPEPTLPVLAATIISQPELSITTSPSMPALGVGSVRVRDKDGMVMIYAPGGTFEMGSTEYAEAQPVHTVTLDGFWIDRTEVTNAQYARCVAAGACSAPQDLTSAARKSYYGDSQYDDYPVIRAAWDDATTYCKWAGARLPTEAEWEYAARGPDGHIYPWGNDPPDGTLLNFDQSVGDTAQVSSYPKGQSWAGALNMAGNVSEWVNDWYGSYPSEPQANPSGPVSGQYRVLRGGSWFNPPRYARAADRAPTLNTVLTRYEYVGFRCVAAPGK